MSHASFASRLSRCPRPYDADVAADISALFEGCPAEVRDLLAGTAGSSPYLHGLMRREAEWLRSALAVAPEEAFEALLAEAASEEDRAAVGPVLRQAKARAALLIALADLGGVWRLEEVTGALTRLADLAVTRAWAVQIGHEIARGKLPGIARADTGNDAGLFALAMGKMGAFELNYSSDIDLIVLFDQERFGEEAMEARSALVRATRNAAQMLSERAADGYVFRTDLRLRPDPSVTPVCLSMGAAEGYYEALGRTWERAAHIKARVCAGDMAAGARYLQALRPFVWRKHLDFAAIQDAHDMRLKIRENKGLHGDIKVEGHDVKLGRGGIREIEFFAQTRQLIAGGRDPELRVSGTVPALAVLAQKDWIPAELAAQLTEDYRAHREVEHRIQMVHDQQTHALPKAPEDLARLAALMDRDEAALRVEIMERCARVHEMTEDFFAPDAAAPMPEVSGEASEVIAGWDRYACLRSDRAREIFERIKPDLLARVAKAGDPAETLTHLDGFLSGLPAGVQLFALFEGSPQLIDLIVDIADTAPELARYLSQHSGVLDAVLAGEFFGDWPGEAALTEALGARLAVLEDYERKLDEARAFQKDWHFRVGVHHLRGLIGGAEAGQQYADIAGACLRGLWPAVEAEFARKHGPAPGRGAALLGMGSLGAERLTATSDLDLIVIYDAAGVEMSEGKRPLAARTYYARLTQALVNAVGARMAQGTLYEIDMRLRPSGKQGPVAASLESYRRYHAEEAWTWEHLALTRARIVAGPEALCAEIRGVIDAVLAGPRDRAKVVADVAEMRARLAQAKGARTVLDAKAGAGRMQDIELLAQAQALLAGGVGPQIAEQLQAGGLLSAEQAARLVESHGLFARVQYASRLIAGAPLDPATLGTGGAAMVLRETGAADLAALERDIAVRSREAAEIIDAVLA